MFTKNAKHYLLFSVVCVILFLSHFIGFAQGEYDIVIEADMSRIAELAWSADSQQVVFFNNALAERPEDIEVELDQPLWQSFDLAARTLLPGTRSWPLQPALDSTELELVGAQQFVRVSSTGDLLIFEQRIGESANWLLSVLNRDTGAIVPLDGLYYPYHPFLPQGDPVVFWGDTDNAFVIQFGTLVVNPRVVHVSIPDPENLQNLTLSEFGDTPINGLPYSVFAPPDSLLDISSDGGSILLIGRVTDGESGIDPYHNEPQLILWVPADEGLNRTLDLFTATQICGASFVPQNDHQIVVATLDGRLALYNLSTDQEEVLFSGPYTTCGPESAFSPDGRWFALHTGSRLAFLNVERLMNAR